ncbi:MAG: CoA-binding protein [Candidatus Hodarchaeales archaeon]
MSRKNGMSCFFNPKSIAIVGVSRNPSKAGYGILKNILWSYNQKDKIYPVNPTAENILGLRVYKSLSDIPADIDLVIFFIRPKIIFEMLDVCVEKKVKGIIIESAGFAEVSDEGRKIQEAIEQKAKKTGIRVWGANCMGTITDSLVTTFEPISEDMRISGGVSIVGQSGYFSGAVILQFFTQRYVGIRKACSIGNRIDVDECDLLQDFLSDGKTRVIAFYLEGFKRPRKFLDLARKSSKPIICLLGGQSEIGKRAALSHTASTASGSPELIKCILKQVNIIQVSDFGEFFDTVEAFAKLPLPNGNKVSIVTITGAGGVIGSDIIANNSSLELPEFSSDTTEKLQKIFPEWMPPKNPLDSWPAFELHGIDKALRTMLPVLFNSKEVDMIILIIACMEVAKTFDPNIINFLKQYRSPVVTYFVGNAKLKDEWTNVIRKNGGIVYDDIKTCIKVFDQLYSFGRKIRQQSK